MTKYRVSVWVAPPDIVVDAKDEEEARDIVDAFVEDCGDDWKEIVLSMDTEIDEIISEEDDEYCDMEYDFGLDSKDPFHYHKLK